MSKPSTVNPLSGGSLTITDPQRKAYQEAWIGMADDLDGASRWLRIGGISEDGTSRLALAAGRTSIQGRLGINCLPSDRTLEVGGGAHVTGSLTVDQELKAGTTLSVDGSITAGTVIQAGKLALSSSPAGDKRTAPGAWTSLSSNAYHGDSRWHFADTTLPAVTLELDSRDGEGRFDVYTTTKAKTQTWELRLSIDGESGTVEVSKQLKAGDEIHSGGTGAGYSFADRDSTGEPAELDAKEAGSRWVLYSSNKHARLATHKKDLVTVTPRGDMYLEGQLTTTKIAVGRDTGSKPLMVEGEEIHSGGTGAGYSFADRASTGDPSTLDDKKDGSRWVLYSSGKSARLWTRGTGDVVTVSPNGDVNVNGQLTTTKKSLFTMWTKEMAVQNAGSDKFAAWTADYKGVFKQVYGVYAVLGGFSIWPITDPVKFANSTGMHANGSGAIPQVVYVRVTDWNNERAVGNSYCSESDARNEFDNSVYFTVVALGIPA